MKISDLNRQERAALEKKVGAGSGYFYLIATGKRNPSPELAKRINKVDPRFTLSDLRPDIWGGTS